MAEHEHGDMDVTQQEKAFSGFVTWTFRSCVVIGAVLVFLALTQT